METKPFIETLKKFDREPGLCTPTEVFAVQRFYRNLDKTLKVYEEVNNSNPFGHTIEAKLDQIKFFVDRANQTVAVAQPESREQDNVNRGHKPDCARDVNHAYPEECTNVPLHCMKNEDCRYEDGHDGGCQLA